jgi:hypothetical protein
MNEHSKRAIAFNCERRGSHPRAHHLPAGQTVTLSGNVGSAKIRLADVGNKLLANIQVKLMLDYRESLRGFFWRLHSLTSPNWRGPLSKLRH